MSDLNVMGLIICFSVFGYCLGFLHKSYDKHEFEKELWRKFKIRNGGKGK